MHCQNQICAQCKFYDLNHVYTFFHNIAPSKHMSHRDYVFKMRTIFFHYFIYLDHTFLPFQIEVSIDCTDYSKLVDQQLDETTMTSAKSHLDTALPELIRELGYTFTANVDQCRANLRQLGGGPDIHAATVARIIGVMVRTHTGLDDPTTLQNMNATGM